MPKQRKNKPNQSDDQVVQDVMAWGKKKDNYYQQGQDQYSQSGQEQLEAQQLYQKQLQQIGHQDNYQIPSAQQSNPSDYQQSQSEQKTQNYLSHAYLTKQIAKVAQLGLKVSEQVDSKVRRVLQTEIQAYLMALIGLRDLKIPYVEYHPLFNQTLQMKQDISKLKRLLESSTLQQQSNEMQEQEDFGQEQGSDEFKEEQQSQVSQELPIKFNKKGVKKQTNAKIQEGLRMYEEVKAQQMKMKAINKQQKRKERQANQKPAFLQVKDNEGRLANEKILKNKGLLKKRKKEDRNSRVKHRRKYQKALSKRRAHGHVIRENPGRQYQGQRNIKYGRIASVKLK